jgi:hypothetical protein
LTIQDSPESPILHVIEAVIPFLTEQIANKNSVLVHCVYGQSRSAVICAAYLISIGMEFETALNQMKRCHPNICINPGFLAQLNIFTHKIKYSLQYEMILNNSSEKNRNHFHSHDCAQEQMVECSDCLSKLLCLDDIIDLHQEDEAIKDSIQPFVDPFWKNYHSLYSSLSQPCNLPSNFLVCRPSQWMINEAQPAQVRIETKEKKKPNKKKRKKDLLPCQPLHCPGCMKVIGGYRLKDEGGILVAGGYILSHLYCLDRSSIFIPKEIEIEVIEGESLKDSGEDMSCRMPSQDNIFLH